MSADRVMAMILAGLIAIIAIWMLWRTNKYSTAYIMEETEQVDGERTLLANAVLAVLQQGMYDLHCEDTASATSVDGHRSYFQIVTPEGHVIVQFDWTHHRVRLFHAYHSNNESGMSHMVLKIRHNLVDEIKLRDFGQQVAATEMEIIEKKILHSEGFKNLVIQALQSVTDEGSNQGDE